MASGNRKSFECGHKGFGKRCHRCDDALTLKDLSEANAAHTTHKKSKTRKPKVWTSQEMMDECDRLLELPRRVERG